jgi:hypothetical protein
MTKKELIEELQNIKAVKQWDKEAAHGDADDALIKFINDKEIKEAYDAIEKWYA